MPTPPRHSAPVLLRRVILHGLLATLLPGAIGLLAQEPPPAPSPRAGETPAASEAEDTVSPPTAVPGEVAPAPGGLRVFVDPETGALTSRPRPEQVRALEALERERVAREARSGERERPARLFAIRGGGVGADVTGRFVSSTVLRLRPDGSFETVCVDHPDQALPHAHEQATPPAAPPTAAPPVQER
jgi:hypothetical protein